ncbi:D-(-)-3-hydroxybutyrate oligomer hydrolase [Undibacterium arcticum]|uniref:D-(-)-3-hydroxybutyrate oligomer hydrolase n=1 Tax=Undibacterium arcticum TaxID=1762892 RepID=A0ABV7F235_9BURK
MKSKLSYVVLATAGVVATMSIGGCGSDDLGDLNLKPVYLSAIVSTAYDGTSDDLLTAGLGKTGLGAASPAAANPLQPSAAELRRIAIFNNYRAVLDISAGGGYGSLYGPNVDIAGNDTLGEGKVAGTEYLAYSDDGSGRQNVMLMVQLPDSFNPASPCIVTGTSSGSRGVYGAIGSAGEWGLKHGCAVAYTDKGTGNGIHDLQANTVSVQNGVRSDATAAGKASNFSADLSDAARVAFNTATPNRFAVKHAHSQQNSEKDWGKWTLQSIEFAYFVLNEKFGVATSANSHIKRFKPGNIITIASSISNGAGAALAAAEQDTSGLISGVAVAEPHVQLAADTRLSVTRGNSTLVGTGRPLYDYFTLANLLQPCAALSTTTSAFNTVNATIAANRCTTLQTNGLISGSSTAELAANAMAALVAAGWQAESGDLQAAMYSFATPAIAMTYSNAYGRFSVADNLCGLSFGATGAATSATPNAPVAAAAAAVAGSFGTGNGVPPTAGINIINNLSVGGPLLDAASFTSAGLQDYDSGAALCQRELAIGSSANARRVQQGVSEALRNGNLHGKPALIVHGRSDTLIPVAFSSRPYFGVNRMVEGNTSKLSYIEIENGQHFDAFLGFPGFANRYIPVHRYFIQAMDLMYANLKSGTALPPSQVVRTVPRGLNGSIANPIALANVPPISMTPVAANQISFNANVVMIPN